MMRDIYDDEIDRLTKDPKGIREAWGQALPLFRVLDRGCGSGRAGCLTMIRLSTGSRFKAYIDAEVLVDLTAEIAADARIPKSPEEITVAHLPVFAEWQRRYDALVAEKHGGQVVQSAPAPEPEREPALVLA